MRLVQDKFACTHCQGDKALSHCLMLCYSSDSSTPRSRLGKGHFSGAPPHVNPKEAGEEDKALGDRIILLAMKLFPISGTSVSRM